MFSLKKPKFKFEFSINDLSNIPHTSGYCYIDIYIGDGSPHGLKAALSQLKPLKAGFNGKDEKGESQDVSTGGESSGSRSSSNSGNIYVRTSRGKIHNFRCHFKFKLSCNLQFPLKRKDNMIGNKYVTLRVFYVADKSSKFDHATELGEVKLNLAEYLNFNEPVTAKYLLQESKINSIVSLTTSLDELPSEMEFHTQLRINDSKNGQSNPSTVLTISKAADLKSRSFNVPQFQRKAVFGGLDGVINSLNQSNSKQALGSNSSEDDKASKTEENASGQQRDTHKSEPAALSSKTIDNVIVDPIIGNLYKKVLESTWDPNLRTLLKLTPDKIVDDIFQHSEDKNLRLLEEDLEHYIKLNQDSDAGAFEGMNGLINESKYRKNLQSWSVSWT